MTLTRQFQSVLFFEFRSRIQLAFLLVPLLFLAHMQLKSEVYRSMAGIQTPVVVFLFVMLAAQYFTPQMMAGWGNKSQIQSYQEFLFTRALDRRICFWAKSTALVLVFWSPLLLLSPLVLQQPKLTVSLLSLDAKKGQEIPKRYQNVFADTEVVLNKKGDAAEKLILPKGRLYLLGWALVWSMFWAMTSQWIVFLFAKWKYGKWFLWAGFAFSMFAPMLLTIVSPATMGFGLMNSNWMESFIFGFYRQPLLCLTGLAFYAFLVEKITLQQFLKTEVT